MSSVAWRLRAIVPGPKLWRGLRTLLHGLCVSLRRALHLGGPDRHRGTDDCCLELAHIYRRPDPLLYSQYYFMSLGLAVTWDNPDIDVIEVDPSVPDTRGPIVAAGDTLAPNRDYWVRVRVWNGSFDAPVVGLPVEMSFLDFGAGVTSNAIGVEHINLGVRGSAHSPSWAWFIWRTPERGGHYCLQANLVWADDANPHNNLGQKNVQIGETHSPAHFEFVVRNTASRRRRIDFAADTYTIPPQDDCREDDGRRTQTWLAETTAGRERARRRHAVEHFSVPESWLLQIVPAAPVLEPGEVARISVAAEPTWTGPSTHATVNIHAYATDDDSRLTLGGITLHIAKGE